MSYGYIKDNTIILNFSEEYYNKPQSLIASEDFKKFLNKYLKHASVHEKHLYDYIGTNTNELVTLMKQLLVLELSEINSPLLENLDKLMYTIHSLYNYWKGFDRYIVVESSTNKSIQDDYFMTVTTEFQNLVRDIYRKLEEKITGNEILVLRQLDSGSKAAINVHDFNDKKYIKKVVLRTPLLLYPKTTTRSGMFKETYEKPVNFLTNDNSYVIAVKIGNYTCHINFHMDFISTVTSLANLYELIPVNELNTTPDMVLYYGNLDGKKEEVFYEEDGILYGNLSYAENLDYFGYCKKMSLTLHNLVAMNKGCLPIHGAFFNLKLNNGTEKNIMMIGDSGAGKSETIEAIQKYSGEKIEKINIIFDDMGIINPDMTSIGTEIGAFIRLDDLDSGASYRDMDRSIFMNPDKNNARVITPVATHKYITRKHKIDYLLYANNYTNEFGFKSIDSVEEVYNVFINAKRMALGTTDEEGISTTYFANPFGPAQRKEQCDVIFKEIFDKLIQSDTFIGEGYTHLGINKDGQGLKVLAEKIIETL